MPHVRPRRQSSLSLSRTTLSGRSDRRPERGRSGTPGQRSVNGANERATVQMSERVTAVLGHPAVTGLVSSMVGRRLRIVAYHAVPDPAVFRRHAEYFAEHYRVVSEAEVAHAVRSGTELPRRGLWLTFDDGDPTVFDVAQPILDGLGLTATAYVCTGVIGTTEPFWWEVIRAADRHGTLSEDFADDEPANVEAVLKRLPDPCRRDAVALVRSSLEEHLGAPLEQPQATIPQLRTWLRAGHGIGNHTVDHPCLDRCTPEEQGRQVTEAHEWLATAVDHPPRTFAYPNGNWAAATEDVLRRHGYETALGFDHRLTRLPRHPLRLSRLRLDADAEQGRVEAIVSGSHPGLMALRDGVRPSRPDDPRILP
jgi:peptidoglycan/xylan/chitin deacetylase (PgdA/CDA1 family)